MTDDGAKHPPGADLDELAPDGWQTMIEREDRGSDRVVRESDSV